jgi:hypothetical protein
MALRLVIAFVACSALASIAAQDLDPNRIRTRTGPPLTDTHANWQILSTGAWWIRLNGATNAREITWRLGKNEGELTPYLPEPNHYLHWNGGRLVSPDLGTQDRRLYPGNMTLWLWEYLQPEQIIYLHARTRPATAAASFCVFYQQQGVAMVQFRGEIEKPVKIDRAERETRCIP